MIDDVADEEFRRLVGDADKEFVTLDRDDTLENVKRCWRKGDSGTISKAEATEQIHAFYDVLYDRHTRTCEALVDEDFARWREDVCAAGLVIQQLAIHELLLRGLSIELSKQ